jgi:hypothetical protein
MKKSTSRSKAADSSAGDQPKNDRPERYNRARPARDHQPEPHHQASGDSTIHNGSAGAFDATEDVRDDEDNDENNDD